MEDVLGVTLSVFLILWRRGLGQNSKAVNESKKPESEIQILLVWLVCEGTAKKILRETDSRP